MGVRVVIGQRPRCSEREKDTYTSHPLPSHNMWLVLPSIEDPKCIGLLHQVAYLSLNQGTEDKACNIIYGAATDGRQSLRQHD